MVQCVKNFQKSENILPPNVSLINTVESGRKNNLKIYKLFEDIKYHAFDFKNNKYINMSIPVKKIQYI